MLYHHQVLKAIMNHTNVVMNRIVQNQKESHSIHGLQRQPCVFLSNLPLDAYEGTIRHAFEQEDIKMVGSRSGADGMWSSNRQAGQATVQHTHGTVQHKQPLHDSS